MKNTILSFTAVFLLIMIVAGGLNAQSIPEDIFESTQSIATAGMFSSDADDFITTDYYNDLEFDKIFMYTSFNTNVVTLGVATRINDMYIAAYYGGNFWSGMQPFNSREITVTGFPINPAGGKKTFTVYTTLPEIDTDITPDNRLALLLGIGDMGIRLSFAAKFRSFSGEDISDGDDPALDDFFKTYSTGYGIISPQIEWAMTRNLMENGIRPRATLNLNFFRDNLKFEMYDPYDGTILGDGEIVGRSNNFFNPQLILNAGGFNLIDSDNFILTADLEWALGLGIYGNDYTYGDAEGKAKTKSISGYTGDFLISGGGGYYNLAEYSWVSNGFTPSIAVYFNAGNFDIGAKFNLPLQFLSASISQMGVYNTSGDIRKDGFSGTISTFYFEPSLNVGMQWNLLPEKLIINAGWGIIFGSIESTTTEGDYYNGGIKSQNSDSSGTVTNFGDGSDDNPRTTNNLTLGVTFLPTSNISIQAMTGINTSSGNNISIFGSGNGLFVFGSLLFSLKF